MILTKNSSGDFYGNPFVIGTTDINEYFPVYVAMHKVQNENIYSRNYGEPLAENIVGDILLYKKPTNSPVDHRTAHTQYADLFHSLVARTEISAFDFKVGDEFYRLICTTGYLADSDDKILLLLCTKSLDLFKDEEKTELNEENLRLYVSTELLKNPVYKNVLKKIQNEYIQECYEKDIDVVFTTSERIQARAYDNHFKVEFTKLSELNEHLKSGLGQNLFFDEQAYHNPFLSEQTEFDPEQIGFELLEPTNFELLDPTDENLPF